MILKGGFNGQRDHEHSQILVDESIPVSRSAQVHYFNINVSANLARNLRSFGYLIDWNSIDALNVKGLWVTAKLKEPFSPRTEDLR